MLWNTAGSNCSPFSYFFSGLRLMLPNGSEIRAPTDALSETQSLIGCCTWGLNYQPESPPITPEPTWRVGSLPACTVHPLPYCHVFIPTHQTLNHCAAILFWGGSNNNNNIFSSVGELEVQCQTGERINPYHHSSIARQKTIFRSSRCKC